MIGDSFGRVVKLRVYGTFFGSVGGDPIISYDQGYTEFSSVQPDLSPGFRIKGKCVQVQPTVGFNTNQITISIYNLGPDSRALIQSRVGTKIEIFAGYGDDVKQIALGDILWARTIKESDTSYVTSIIAGDSHFTLVNGQMSQSFKGQTSYVQVVNAIMTRLKLDQMFAGTQNIPSGGYSNGIVLSRSPLDELAAVCQKMGRTMSVVGGGVYILPIGQDAGSPVLTVSTETGMIGIPEVNPPGLIGVVPPGVPVSPDLAVSFTHLLRAELTLSQKVSIVSEFINGQYVILRNEFDFDSWSGPFYNHCECGKVTTNVG